MNQTVTYVFSQWGGKAFLWKNSFEIFSRNVTFWCILELAGLTFSQRSFNSSLKHVAVLAGEIPIVSSMRAALMSDSCGGSESAWSDHLISGSAAHSHDNVVSSRSWYRHRLQPSIIAGNTHWLSGAHLSRLRRASDEHRRHVDNRCPRMTSSPPCCSDSLKTCIHRSVL